MIPSQRPVPKERRKKEKEEEVVLEGRKKRNNKTLHSKQMCACMHILTFLNMVVHKDHICIYAHT